MPYSAEHKESLSKTLLNVAWMAVLLGLGMEVLVLIAAAGFGKVPAVKVIVAELVQKVSWSTFVCMGVAVGTGAARLRAPAMGLAGLISAPLAFSIAKILHKGTTEALAIAAPTAGAPSPFVIAAIKALEYGLLGFLVGKLADKFDTNFRMYALTGLIVGIVFGGTLVLLTVKLAANPLPLAGIVIRSINEIVFPVGCSLVLYAANVLKKRMLAT